MERKAEPKPRILVMNGDSVALNDTLGLLSEAGYDVLGTTTGKTGLRRLRDYHPDLLIVDSSLSDISEREVTRALEANPGLAALLVINASDYRTLHEHQPGGMTAGADGYLVGPLPGHDLLARIDTLLLQKRTEKALRASEARLFTIIDRNPDSILIVDHEGEICFANPMAERLFQRQASELVGVPFEHPLVPERITEVQLTHQECHTSTVELRVSEISWEGRPARLVFLRDMTEHKRAEEEIRIRLRQQAAIVDLGQDALNGGSLAQFKNAAAHTVARVFGTDYCSLMKLLPGGRELRLVAGAGWDPQLVGRALVGAGRKSQAGFALLSGEPVIMENVRTETRYSITALLREYGVVSSIAVPVPGEHGPWGVLGAHAVRPRVFTRDDIGFIQSVANLIAQTIQRTQADVAIRQNAVLLGMAGRMARLGGWVADLDQDRVSWSDEVCAIHEMPPGTSLPLREAISFYAPEWQARIREIFDVCLRDGTPYDEELQIITAGGRRIWVRTIGEAVRNSSGAVSQVQGAFQDITEKKQGEERLQQLAARLTNTLESITDAFITLDHTWRFTYINKEAERLLRSCRQDLLGKNVWDEFQELTGTVFEFEYRRALREHRTVEFEALYPPLGLWFEVHAYPSEEGLAIYFQDITERKQAEIDIQRLALYDPLTLLPNRRLLLDRLHQAMAACTRSHEMGAVLFLDLDNFKTLNDTLGHDIGDQLLQQVASRLTASIREGDTVGRFGGDEFVVILERLSERTEEAAMQAEAVGEKILFSLNQPYWLSGNHEHHSTSSIGITLFGEHRAHDTADDVMKRADLAMYEAKDRGRNTLRLFDPAMQATINARSELESEMREGLQRQEFVPYYQPQMDAEGRLTGAEALMRWRHPRLGVISPADFIPVAEDTGLIVPLGRSMLEAVCAQLASWAERPETAHLSLAVNISARQFHHPAFVEQVLEVLDNSGANPEKLKLELTESMLLQDMEEAIIKMRVLKTRGVGFSLDDFGTGYSSLYYLRRLPLEQIKIDQRFISELHSDPSDAAIVRTIVILAGNLGLSAIAEGVETEAVREVLARQGCHAYQGYLFAPPLPIGKLETFMQAQ